MYQFRYYGTSSKNYPSNLTPTIMSNHKLFQGKNAITHLGIQAAPGTMFFLNQEINPIQIGKTGIFELDVSGYGYITHLAFAEKTLDLVNEDNGIIIDILYEGGSV
jgi:hypothetical protein